MNNVIGIILGITDDNNPEWKYINRKGHIITCTKAQFKSYFKKRGVDHDKIMKEAVDALFAPCAIYACLHKEKGGERKDVINSREKLVQEYLRCRITTEIVSQDKEYFKVAVTSDIKGRIDTIYISRAQFRKWLKNRKKGGK